MWRADETNQSNFVRAGYSGAYEDPLSDLRGARSMSRPPLPAPPYYGGCLCGAVRYEAKARPLALNACHCIDCKRISGGSHFAGVHIEATDFEASGETIAFVKTADSGRTSEIHRCARCGTRMWHIPQQAPHLLFFTAGTLDDSSWFVPTSHIWTRSAQPDVKISPDALQIEAQPADRQTLWDRFAEIYKSEL